MKISKILVPIDGSELSERALGQAVSLAQSNSAQLIVLRVMDPGSELSGEFSVTAYGTALDEMQKELKNYLALQQQELQKSGLEVECVSQVGQPAKRIVKVAEEKMVDLIVMSSHGRSGIRRWFLGSVAEEVLRHSSVPILMLPMKMSESE